MVALCSSTSSKHSLDEVVDLVLSVAEGATVLIRMSLLFESLLGGVKLEGPEEVVSLLEVGSNAVDLVDEIFNTDDTVLSEFIGNDLVVRKRDSAAVDLSVASLVDELLDDGS